MNQSQRLAALILRLVGFAVAFIGIEGPVYAGIAYLVAGTKIAGERWAGSGVWAVCGILLVLVSKPLGRLIGSDLD